MYRLVLVVGDAVVAADEVGDPMDNGFGHRQQNALGDKQHAETLDGGVGSQAVQPDAVSADRRVAVFGLGEVFALERVVAQKVGADQGGGDVGDAGH